MSSREKFDAVRRVLEETVVGAPGDSTAEARRAAADGAATGAAAAYLAKVREHAYQVTDEDVAAARAAGLSEDALFELTCAAAVGAARQRLESARRALDAAEEGERAARQG